MSTFQSLSQSLLLQSNVNVLKRRLKITTRRESQRNKTIIISILTLLFLRPMAGCTLMGEKRSSDISEQLSIININEKLTPYKLNWREHILRMDGNRLPKAKFKLQT